MGFRHPASGTTAMPMPEAAIHKDQLSAPTKNKVGTTWYVRDVYSIAIAERES
jgi:hypothetical protein